MKELAIILVKSDNKIQLYQVCISFTFTTWEIVQNSSYMFTEWLKLPKFFNCTQQTQSINFSYKFYKIDFLNIIYLGSVTGVESNTS